MDLLEPVLSLAALVMNCRIFWSAVRVFFFPLVMHRSMGFSHNPGKNDDSIQSLLTKFHVLNRNGCGTH